MGPTVFLARIVAAIAKLPQLLILAIEAIIPLADSDEDADEFTWPSHIVMGSCMCPLTSQPGSLRQPPWLLGLLS